MERQPSEDWYITQLRDLGTILREAGNLLDGTEEIRWLQPLIAIHEAAGDLGHPELYIPATVELEVFLGVGSLPDWGKGKAGWEMSQSLWNANAALEARVLLWSKTRDDVETDRFPGVKPMWWVKGPITFTKYDPRGMQC